MRATAATTTAATAWLAYNGGMQWRGAVAVVASLAVGCGGDGPGGGGVLTPTRTFRNRYPDSVERKLDLLFVIDNSSDTEDPQANLRANIPRFIDVLEALPYGPPNLHVAVVSSDMGVGHDDIPGCNATGGDNGIFRFGVAAAADGCTSTGLNPGATYVSSTGGANPQNNFSGDIAQVLQCILPIGGGGCGYKQQLRSMARALGADGLQLPAENEGFLRPEATLGIVLLTNVDDCSAATNAFYDVATNINLSSPLGPPGRFRCSEFGHLCDGAPPNRMAPSGQVTDIVTYDKCVSSEGQGQLIPVSAFAAGVKSLKPDPASQIVVAGIQGPATPYQIHWKPPGVSTDPPWPDITHSCVLGAGSIEAFADPGVRMQQFVQEFGGNGLVYSICQDNLAPALNVIAAKMSGLLGPKCVFGTLADRNRDPSDGVQPDCTVIDRMPQSGTTTTASAVPACTDNLGTPPCWTLRAPTATEGCPDGSHVLEIDRGGVAPEWNTEVELECQVCIPGVPDPAASCP
jgi:hypothetical protein